jgi:hypothetical protein
MEDEVADQLQQMVDAWGAVVHNFRTIEGRALMSSIIRTMVANQSRRIQAGIAHIFGRNGPELQLISWFYIWSIAHSDVAVLIDRATAPRRDRHNARRPPITRRRDVINVLMIMDILSTWCETHHGRAWMREIDTFGRYDHSFVATTVRGICSIMRDITGVFDAREE